MMLFPLIKHWGMYTFSVVSWALFYVFCVFKYEGINCELPFPPAFEADC